jgi:hypothetical protein
MSEDMDASVTRELILLSQKVASRPLRRINYGARFGWSGMDLQSTTGSEARFTAYAEGLVSVIGGADLVIADEC